MKLTERLNVLIQATTLSQKNGALTLDDAVKAKYAIDVITSGILNQDFSPAISTLIEIILASQKKGVYSLKDAHMIFLAVDGIENEFQNEVNRINGVATQMEPSKQQAVNQNSTENIEESDSTITPKKIKRNSKK